MERVRVIMIGSNLYKLECKKYDVTFCFIETGTVFIKDGKKVVITFPIKEYKARWRINRESVIAERKLSLI